MEEIVAMLEITTNPHRPGSGIGARRKNGDRIYLRGETIRQLRTVRKLLMKLSRQFGLPLAAHADFAGIEIIKNVTNNDLIDCLSTVPDPYSGVSPRQALIAAMRDARICHRILAQDPTLDQLFSVTDNIYDWGLWWRCNHPTAAGRERFARDLEGMLEQMTENRRRYEQIKERANGNGQAN
jgi:hypothetical protein